MCGTEFECFFFSHILGLTSLYNSPNRTQFLFRPTDYNKILTECKQLAIKFVIWGFRRDVDENCAVLGYYAASSKTQKNLAVSYHIVEKYRIGLF
jgi:hypothetical protein